MTKWIPSARPSATCRSTASSNSPRSTDSNAAANPPQSSNSTTMSGGMIGGRAASAQLLRATRRRPGRAAPAARRSRRRAGRRAARPSRRRASATTPAHCGSDFDRTRDRGSRSRARRRTSSAGEHRDASEAASVRSNVVLPVPAAPYTSRCPASARSSRYGGWRCRSGSSSTPSDGDAATAPRGAAQRRRVGSRDARVRATATVAARSPRALLRRGPPGSSGGGRSATAESVSSSRAASRTARWTGNGRSSQASLVASRVRLRLPGERGLDLLHLGVAGTHEGAARGSSATSGRRRGGR